VFLSRLRLLLSRKLLWRVGQVFFGCVYPNRKSNTSFAIECFCSCQLHNFDLDFEPDCSDVVGGVVFVLA
jgi:hypothetical protein